MKPTPQAIENAARKICQSGKFETGQGTCAVLCMDQLGDVRKKGCGHCVRVHGKLARDVLSCDLGDMVLVPKEALAWLFGEGPDADGHWFEPPEIKEGERKKPYWWRSRFRAMLSAAQGDADDRG